MKHSIFLFCLLLGSYCVKAQQKKPTQLLPPRVFVTMRDSTTSIDIVLMLGKGGSLSIDGRNVHPFNSFFDYQPAEKTGAPQAGSIMWLINGREFLSGNFYLGDSTGYLIVTRQGKEYVSRINAQGNSFFKNQINR